MSEQADKLLQEATTLRDNGQGPEAAEKYYQAAEMYEKEENWQKVAECWHMAGVSWKHEQQRALKAFESALEYYQKAGDPVGESQVMRDQAASLIDKEEYSEGLNKLEASEETLRSTSAPAELAITMAKIGHVLAKIGEREKAEMGFDEALRLLRNHPQWLYEATTLMHFAELKLLQENYNDAVTLLLAAASALSNEKPEDSQKQVFNSFTRQSAVLFGLLSMAYLGLGNQILATQYLKTSFDYIAPMPDGSAEAIIRDIRLNELSEMFKQSHPESFHEIEEHPVYKKFAPSS